MSAAPREEGRQTPTRLLLVLGSRRSAISISIASALRMLPAADATRAVPTIGAIAAITPLTFSASIPTLLAASRFSMYETGGASAATSAAMRTSISVSVSRSDAASDSAVMLTSKSRTGVSVVDSGMVLLSVDVRSGLTELDGLDLARPPALVEERLERVVEPKNRPPALAGNGLEPVGLFTAGSCRPEVDVGRAIGVRLDACRIGCRGEAGVDPFAAWSVSGGRRGSPTRTGSRECRAEA